MANGYPGTESGALRFVAERLGRTASSAGQLTEYVVLLDDLKPETKYYYAFGTQDVPLLIAISNSVVTVRATNGMLWLGTTNRTQLARERIGLSA